MNAIRNVLTVENNKVIIDLPNNFNSKKVEIIVLPYSDQSVGDLNESVDIDSLVGGIEFKSDLSVHHDFYLGKSV